MKSKISIWFLYFVTILFLLPPTYAENSTIINDSINWIDNENIVFVLGKGSNHYQLTQINLKTKREQTMIDFDGDWVRQIEYSQAFKISSNKKFIICRVGQTQALRYNTLIKKFKKFNIPEDCLSLDVDNNGNIIFNTLEGVYLNKDSKIRKIIDDFTLYLLFSGDGNSILATSKEKILIYDIKRNLNKEINIKELPVYIERSPMGNVFLIKLLHTILPEKKNEFKIGIYNLNGQYKTINTKALTWVTWHRYDEIIYCTIDAKYTNYVIKKFNINTLEESMVLEKKINIFSGSPDGKHLAFISEDENEVLIYNLDTGKCDLIYKVK